MCLHVRSHNSCCSSVCSWDGRRERLTDRRLSSALRRRQKNTDADTTPLLINYQYVRRQTMTSQLHDVNPACGARSLYRINHYMHLVSWPSVRHKRRQRRDFFLFFFCFLSSPDASSAMLTNSLIINNYHNYMTYFFVFSYKTLQIDILHILSPSVFYILAM